MASAVPSITPAQVDRFVRAFSAFVKEAGDAVADAASNPELASTPQFEAWRGKVLPLLEQDNAAVQRAVAQYQAGDVRGILAEAEDKRGLAKDMDGFPLTFAGPDHAQILGELRTAVVRSACQLCDAAGIR
ncbi:MAG: hypothetical protein WBG54_18085 [Acidobacteriaceae bacterium]